MIEYKTWTEFRETGLLWFINTILNLFGWALVYDTDTEVITPARTTFRGFNDDINDMGYKQVSTFLKDNIDTLLQECD